MIVFDLKCAREGHVFEAWFGSGADYEAQRERGLVACPVCGAAEVDKAPMAAQVPARSRAGAGPTATEAKALLVEMAGIQRKLLESSDFVGDRFPDEARAIHLGEARARAIHGRASGAEAQSLADEGIPVSPLLFPVVEPGQEN